MANLNELVHGYVVEEFLGNRSGAWFYRVRQHGNDAVLLLRVFSPALARKQGADIAPISEEDRALHHPSLLSVVDLGEYADPVKRRFLRYTIESYYDTSQLVQVAKGVERELLDPADAVDIGADLSAVLSYLEAHDTCHGAVLPSNVLLTADGRASLVHPVIARLMAVERETEEDQRITVADFCRAPERDKGGPASMAADIYGCAAILFFLLTGKLPGASKDTRPDKKLGAPDPRALRADLPRPLTAVLVHALQTNPGERYRTARELADDLYELAEGGSPSHALDAVGDRIPRQKPRLRRTLPSELSSPEDVDTAAKRPVPPPMVIAIGVAVVVLIGLIVALTLGGGD